MWAVTTEVAVFKKYRQKLPHSALGAALVTSHAPRASKHDLSIVAAIRVPCVVVLNIGHREMS